MALRLLSGCVEVPGNIRDQEVHVVCVNGISGIVACSQFYSIGGSTYVGAGIGATLYGAIIV